MDDVRGVHVVRADQDLEHEVLHMVVGQVLSGVDDSVHVGLHQISDNIDVLVASLSRRSGHLEEVNDVLVVEELQKLNFSDDTLRIDQVFESLGDFLDGNFDLALVVISTADHTVRTVPDLFNIFKLFLDTEGGSYTKSSLNDQILENSRLTSADEFLQSLVLCLLLDWSLDLLLDLLLVGGSLVFDGLSVSLLLLLLCLLTLPLGSVLVTRSLLTLLIDVGRLLLFVIGTGPLT